ncbi:MAG: T9SS type A sorting domain-containing protein, partial [Bacteroidota bacterium]
GPGVEVAQADGVVPTTVDYQDYEGAYETNLGIIGWDWKTFTGMGWSLPDDRAYFLKTASGDIWRIYFIDFAGSSNGTATMNKELVSSPSSTNELPEQLSSLVIYPNPARGFTQILLDWERPVNNARLHITNSIGQVVRTEALPSGNGLQAVPLDVADLRAGYYNLIFDLDGQRVTRTLIVQ